MYISKCSMNIKTSSKSPLDAFRAPLPLSGRSLAPRGPDGYFLSRRYRRSRPPRIRAAPPHVTHPGDERRAGPFSRVFHLGTATAPYTRPATALLTPCRVRHSHAPTVRLPWITTPPVRYVDAIPSSASRHWPRWVWRDCSLCHMPHQNVQCS